MPTLMLLTLLEMAEAFRPPRPVFVDFPIGSPTGRPNDPAMQREVLQTALDAASSLGDPWRIATLPFQWSRNGGREWEETVRTLYREHAEIVRAHGREHRAVGQPLRGREKELAVRCAC